MPQKKRLIYRLKDYLNEHYPFTVRKLAVHTRLGCPHRDGRHGEGGCVYCYNPGFSTIDEATGSVREQIQSGIQRSRKRGFAGKFIVYFQSETNTYGEVEQLHEWWGTIEDFPEDIVGLAIGTRPDCISEDILDHLGDLANRYMVWLELGLQSVHDQTLELINRGHDYQCFQQTVELIRYFPKILICGHIILGLPGESIDEMRYTIHEINRMNLEGVKIHHLQVVWHTALAEWYAEGSVKVFTANEYVALLCELLPELSADVVVHRLVGDIRDDLLIAPRWEQPKTQVIQRVEKLMEEKGVWQGSRV
ncbi:TIGR01212 family radical SAM protein [candidate division KSB1 bacterium]|nr:TIGR01212 family radical SAM protein [candidate division KSB1 bacterium]